MMNTKDFFPLEFSDKEKSHIQLLAYDSWQKKKSIGTCVLPTGVGKTQIGLMAMLKTSGRTLIVVPTIHLQQQWAKAITSIKTLSPIDVGLVGGGYKEWDHDVVISVVNSVRNEEVKFDLIIVDEVHRLSDKNLEFLKKSKYNKALGLTATIERSDNTHLLITKILPIVFSMQHSQAMDKKILSSYELKNVPVGLTSAEQIELDVVDAKIKKYMRHFEGEEGKLFSYLKIPGRNHKKFLAILATKQIQHRRKLLLSSSNKITKTVNLILESPDIKTIVFTEFKETANIIHSLLKSNKQRSLLYHSDLDNKTRKEVLRSFRDEEYNILISVRCLDEGIDVPSLERAIVVAGSSVKRQHIQRIGRVLRKEAGKTATIIQLYHPNTKDQEWLNRRSLL